MHQGGAKNNDFDCSTVNDGHSITATFVRSRYNFLHYIKSSGYLYMMDISTGPSGGCY